MKRLITFVCCLQLLAAYGQKDTLLSLPSFPMLYYRYFLEFSPIAKTSVDPYSALFSGQAKTADPSVNYPPRVEEKRNYWFDYAPARQEFYQPNGGLTYTKTDLVLDSIRRTEPATALLTCSKVKNSRGKDVFIYFTILIGPDDTERLNPCLAFDALEQSNTETYWEPSSFLRHTTALVGDYDLEAGTYFFNWWDEKDALHPLLSDLWEEKRTYENALRHIRSTDDSLRALFRSTGDRSYLEKANADRSFSTTENAYEQQKLAAYQAILQMGYGSEDYFQEHKALRFEIRKAALTSHKLSVTPISPEELQRYLSDPKLKRPAAVGSLLDIFTTTPSKH